ncbi:SDR family oxidoreductase [Micromonospora chalcea]|uniref:SDR family NAD(P)-dependent oxidoreductase n=1 Tax=Micromonospora sp. TSRI0369 TaxID=1703936 RepID=UPI00093B1446|nr:SDR family oxidoreductase [Micromonospora sp. TSRI0369]OKJ40184.1 short-chain dehydrogenase [Micromonospora sp. TSRI0369]
MRLVDRVAVVTGGASGIGLATVGRLVEEGARVVIADLDGDRAAEAAAGFGSAVVGVACDVTRAEDCRAAVETAVERFGRLDLMHANAGTPFTGPLDEVDQATLDRVIDVNLKGAFWTAQAAAPALIEAGGGSIVFTASLQAVIARPRYAPYTAAKHGVIGLMKALALELAPHGIRVNAIAPAATETPMLSAFLGGMGDVPDSARENFRASIPLGRMATPRDSADAVVFLASDEARMVTGHTLVLDGGTTAG